MDGEKSVPLSVNVSGEDITKAVSQAILDSVVGDEIKKAIEELIGGAWSHNNIVTAAVREAVKKEMSGVVLQILREREEEMKAIVRELLTDDLVKEMTGGVIDGMLALLRRD